jgi:2-polyprenyl-6-methoxyphenol hydroxylase-like FAD-dependent oxidoreductase
MILIAGGGPVGMTLALDLARRGIACTLVEHNPTTTRHPKMDITNGRSMELFRRLGLGPALRAAAVPEDNNFDVSWVTGMSGRELHRFRYPSVTEWRRLILERNDGTQPVEPAMRVSQVEIEPVLKRAIDAAPEVTVRFGTAFEDLSQDADGVTAVLRDSATGAAETVRCRYLIGCDGGTSQVRQCLRIGLSGESRVAQRFMTHFRSDARAVLQRWGVAWHYQAANGTLIAQNDRDIWTLQSRDAGSDDPAGLLRSFLGCEIPHEILVANPWTPHLLVADSYARGRVLLCGDAAHQYIPTGGYGMNTGIGDACDLAWKLAAVLHGFAAPSLLDSYEIERRPVGLRNREASRAHTEVRKHIAGLYRDLGHDPAALATAIAAAGNDENHSFGIELGYHYADSPFVCADGIPSEDPVRYEPSTVPGVRLPSVVLPDGVPLHDRLGPWFTLVGFDTAPDPTFVAAAARLGVPLAVLRVDGFGSVYGQRQVLMRPDQHIAWRGGACDAEAVLRRATGRLHFPASGPTVA